MTAATTPSEERAGETWAVLGMRRHERRSDDEGIAPVELPPRRWNRSGVHLRDLPDPGGGPGPGGVNKPDWLAHRPSSALPVRACGASAQRCAGGRSLGPPVSREAIERAASRSRAIPCGGARGRGRGRRRRMIRSRSSGRSLSTRRRPSPIPTRRTTASPSRRAAGEADRAALRAPGFSRRRSSSAGRTRRLVPRLHPLGMPVERQPPDRHRQPGPRGRGSRRGGWAWRGMIARGADLLKGDLGGLFPRPDCSFK